MVVEEDGGLFPGVTQVANSSPSGTVTFLFTDIEGSTLMWENHQPQMESALARHDGILRSAVEGTADIFKMVGDACCAAFASARSALLAALSAQRILFAEDWDEKCRIKVSDGPPYRRGRGARRGLFRAAGEPGGAAPLGEAWRAGFALGGDAWREFAISILEGQRLEDLRLPASRNPRPPQDRGASEHRTRCRDRHNFGGRRIRHRGSDGGRPRLRRGAHPTHGRCGPRRLLEPVANP